MYDEQRHKSRGAPQGKQGLGGGGLSIFVASAETLAKAGQEALAGPRIPASSPDTELPRKGRCSVASSYSTHPAAHTSAFLLYGLSCGQGWGRHRVSSCMRAPVHEQSAALFTSQPAKVGELAVPAHLKSTRGADG